MKGIGRILGVADPKAIPGSDGMPGTLLGGGPAEGGVSSSIRGQTVAPECADLVGRPMPAIPRRCSLAVWPVFDRSAVESAPATDDYSGRGVS